MPNNLSGRDLASIGRRITALRKARKMNQRQFAAFCGITPQTLNNFEQGLQRPSIESAGAIMGSVGGKLDWIYYGDKASLPTDLAAAIFAPPESDQAKL